jgi:serine/threonine protein kinase
MSDADSESSSLDGTSTDASIDLGTGVQNELPEFDVDDRLDQSNDTEVTLVSLADTEIPAIKKSTVQGATIGRGATEAMIEEAETWASVDDHPNVVSVYGWGGTPYPWILVEYVDGGDLHTINLEALEFSEAISMLTQICDGLLHGHERGIYHLDVKPENVLVNDVDGTAKLSDWGSAVRFDTGLDAAEFTPAYTAPELLPSTEGSDPSPRSDIFEVGIIAYELLTGVHPFRTDHTEDTITAIKSETPKPPSELNSSLPREIDEPILKALEKDPENRYKTVTQFKNDLESAAN